MYPSRPSYTSRCWDDRSGAPERKRERKWCVRVLVQLAARWRIRHARMGVLRGCPSWYWCMPVSWLRVCSRWRHTPMSRREVWCIMVVDLHRHRLGRTARPSGLRRWHVAGPGGLEWLATLLLLLCVCVV